MAQHVGAEQQIDLTGLPVRFDAKEFAGLASMVRKPPVDELRSLSRPIALYAIEVA
jgi:hypothetical protein